MPIVKDKYRGTTLYHLVHAELITAARYRGTITYQEIAQIMGLPLQGSHMSKETGHLLVEISEDEHLGGRPMLSAIAVRVNGSPGDGFFSFARDLKKLTVEGEEARERFWESEKAGLYDVWKRPLRRTE
jgi:hypothetical protein